MVIYPTNPDIRFTGTLRKIEADTTAPFHLGYFFGQHMHGANDNYGEQVCTSSPLVAARTIVT